MTTNTEQTPDASTRLREYLEAQLAEKRQKQSMPDPSVYDSRSDGAFAALLGDSVAKIGSLGGKTADSGYGLAQYNRDIAAQSDAYRRDAKEALASNQTEGDRRAKLYESLNALRRQEKSDARDDYKAETERLKLSSKDAQPKRRTQLYTDDSGNQYLVDLDNGSRQAIGKVDKKASARSITSSEMDYKTLPKEQQYEVETIAKKNATRKLVSDSIRTELDKFRQAQKSGDEDLAVAVGKNMLKILNSTEGSDAVGAEEAKRLASFLEYKLFNFREPGSFMGRDLDKFDQQLDAKIGAIDNSIKLGQNRLDQIYGRSPQYDVKLDEEPIPSTSGGNGEAVALPSDVEVVGGMKLRKLPDGSYEEVE